MQRALPPVLTGLALVWLAAVIAAAPVAASDSASPIAAMVYQAAALLCHQIRERSFELAGVPLPVCARCLALYTGGAAGAVAAWLSSPSPPHRTRAPLIVAALPLAATVVAEWAGQWQPSNIVRAVASLPLGAAGGWVFIRMLRAEARPAGCAMIA